MAAARPAKKKRNTDSTATVETGNASFEGFMPYLIAKLAWQLNADLIEKLRQEGINIALAHSGSPCHG